MRRLPEPAAVPRTGVLALVSLLVVGALFAGDSFWVAAGALAIGGGVLALALVGVVPLPRGGEYVLGSLLALAALERAIRRLVGRVRPLVGRARPDARVRRLRAARARPRRAVRDPGVPGRRRAARRCVRCGSRLGARREGDPVALRGRRQGGAPARSHRLLERPRARGRRVARPGTCGSPPPGPTRDRCVWPRRRSASGRSWPCCSPVCAPRGSSPRLPGSRSGWRSTTAVSSAASQLLRSLCRRSSSRPGRSREMRSSRTDRPTPDRVSDGRWFALACVFGGAAAVAAGRAPRPLSTGRGFEAPARTAARRSSARRPRDRRRRRRCGRRPAREHRRRRPRRSEPPRRRRPQQPRRALARGLAHLQGPSRGRLRRGHVRGSRKRHRADALDASEPHDLPLQFLATTGLVGLALFCGLVAASAAAVVAALRRLQGPERVAAAALAVVPALYLLHALVDYDWDFPGVTGPTLLAVGALAAAGREPAAASRHTFAATAAAAVTLAALVSLRHAVAGRPQRPPGQPRARRRRPRRRGLRRRPRAVAEPAVDRRRPQGGVGGRAAGRRDRGPRGLRPRRPPPAAEPGHLVRARPLRARHRRALSRPTCT